MNIVCISGKRRSGKSTLANLLKDQYGWYPISLASPLKQLVMQEFKMTPEQVDGELKEVVDIRYKKTPRQVLIEVGQFFRSFDKDWWVNKLIHEMYKTGAETCVIPDVRFINELNALKPFGAYCVRLDRREDLTGTNINDVSETELDTYVDWDLRVAAEFNVDMTDMRRIADRVAAGVLARR